MLKSKVFERYISNIEEQAQLQEDCSEWMDKWEISYIEQYDTYNTEHGRNRTSGGQTGWEMAYHLNNLKKSQEMFHKKYMPAFRTYNNSIRNRLWDMPQDTIVGKINLGRVLSNMRTGITKIPIDYLEELNDMGYNNGKSTYESKWKIDYMLTFRMYNNNIEQKNRLWDMTQDTIVNNIKLGVLLSGIRDGSSPIPAEYLKELNNMGYNNGKSRNESRWKNDYMPAFRAYNIKQNNSNRLWNMPYNTIINTINLGSLLSHMRSGSPVPAEYLDELNNMGYNNGKSKNDSKWEIDYIPTFRVYNNNIEQKTRLWDMPINVIIDKIKLGILLSDMRAAHSTIPSEHLKELNGMGYNNGKSKNDSKWEIDYMPAFREYNVKQNNSNRLWNIPQDTIVNTINLGKLLSHMRKGSSPISTEYLEELNDMGYNNGKSTYESKWEIDYMPAFRAYNIKQNNSNRLWNMPYNTIINTINLCKLLSHMREGSSPIPAKHMEELNDMGYNNDKSTYESKWEIDHMPAFRTYNIKQNNNNRLWTMSRKNTIINTINLGALIYNTKKSNVPPVYMNEMNTMGYYNGRPYRDLIWEIDYIPAFRAYGTPLHTLKKNTEQNGINIGSLYQNLKHKPSRWKRLSPTIQQELNQLGARLYIG